MKTKITLFLFLLMLLPAQVAVAQQRVKLTTREQTILEEQAKAKVKSFQNYCRDIGNKKHTLSQKEAFVKTALNLFTDEDRMIAISNLDGKITRKKVYTYLRNLSKLGYQEIQITSYQCEISKNMKPSVTMNKKHPGEDWYEGTVSIIQRFEGRTGDFTYSDVVKRTMTVYAQRTLVIATGEIRWALFLGDIDVKVLSVGKN